MNRCGTSYSRMSSRAAANLADEMEALAPVRLTEVQDAQKRIINIARTRLTARLFLQDVAEIFV